AHTCALTPFDGAFCWGWNYHGQPGDGTNPDRLAPVQVPGGLGWRQLSAGAAHTCGVTTGNRAY
ncbi:MAG: RCC1 domain-containing protein, partial [Gemmatimonadales bacterium]